MKRFIFLLSALYITVNASAICYLVNGLCYTKIAGTQKTVQLFLDEPYGQPAILPELADAGGTITIPSTVVIDGETYTVVRIGDYAFCFRYKITNVIIPNTVKSIGRYAFYHTGITSIEIPNSVEVIEEVAFGDCPLRSVKLSNKVYKLEKFAFSANDFSSIVIPRSVVEIGDRAFERNSLNKVFVRNSDPSTITWGNDVFYSNYYSCTLCVPPGTKDRFEKSLPSYYSSRIVEEGSNALHFDGVDDYVSLPMQFYKHGAFTIEMWIKPDVIPATGIVSLLNTNSWNTDANGASVHFQISDSKLSLAVNGINDGHPTSSYTPIPNVWQHIAVTYARGVAVKFYVNGNLVSTVTKGYVMPIAKIDDACLGSWGGTSRFFNGAIDEVRVWNEVLTEQQIRDNMNVSFENTAKYMPNPQYFPSYLDLNYNFNQGFASQYNIYATDLTDYSSKYTDGTLHNFTLNGGTSNFVKGVDFPILYVSSKTDTISSANNSNDTIKVSSNVKWDVQSDQSWLKTNLDSSTGNGEFILTATENSTNDARTATVTVSAIGTVTKTITVTQVANAGTGIVSPSKETLAFSPNPTQKGFTINVGEQSSILSIYDLSGSLILTKQISGKSYIDVTALPSGIYTVKANGRVGKLIKK